MKYYIKRVSCFIVLVVFLASANQVLAKAWWGDGYKSPEWVISHGGTLIYYSSKGYKKKYKDDIVIDLYCSNGAIIETERGKKGVFDDGVAGDSYYLKAELGKDDFKSEVFTMQRGSTNYAVIDFKKEKVYFTFEKPKRKVVPKKQIPVKRVITKEEVNKLVKNSNNPNYSVVGQKCFRFGAKDIDDMNRFCRVSDYFGKVFIYNDRCIKKSGKSTFSKCFEVK